ncbi:MAG: lysophospholipid acyltransferase family protein [Gemmatimonadetes bacterium]|nr:lysophospholipid acyltransferase family protein [Gemmatimonadota bacterium]
MSESARDLLRRDRVRFRHRIEYAALRSVLAGSVLLSDERAAAAGAALGRLGYPLGISREVVETNLRIAFPDAAPGTRERIARASYEHLGRETMMMLRLASMSRATLIDRTRTINEDEFAAAVARGRGVVVVAGHLGNWEIGAAAMTARGYPGIVIAKRAANPLFYETVLSARERLGVGVIDFQRATRQGLQALRSGRAVAFAADQHAGRSGLWVPFFGRPASTYRGPALMALRTGAAMFLSIPLRLDDGTYRITFEPIEVKRTGDMDADVLRTTEAYTQRLEAAVRANPEQYVWQHRRWRKPPLVANEEQEAAPEV